MQINEIGGYSIMTAEEEHSEYEKFCIEFLKKTKEIKDDYNKMTMKNQARFKNEAENMIASNGMLELLKYFRK